MIEEVQAYIEYLAKFKQVERVEMPNFDVEAYTDNEYLQAIFDLMKDFDSFIDLDVTINRLKG